MGRIVKLDQHIASLIAAGEVIARPVSVVKEAVENAIDANSTIIKVSIVDAGLKEITISDNGIGMDAIDAKMAVLPHCTSKLKKADDLFNINTLGFRGEALASIASISNLLIKTSEVDGKGVMLRFRDGNIVSEATISIPKGTTIIVKDLFYNTPARLQSIGSSSLEISYITDFITKIALAYPDISFILVSNDKEIFRSYGNGSMLEVISLAYGNDIAKEMIEFASENNYFSIEGYTSKIRVARSNRSHITLLINGRVIRNNNINNAIIKGYGTRLMTGKYPVCIMNINTDPRIVDVNVHPSKTEVRFSMEDELCELVIHAIDEVLNDTDLIVNNSYEVNDEIPKIDNSPSYDIPSLDIFDTLDNKVLKEEDGFIFKEEEIDTLDNEPLEETKEEYVAQRFNLFSEGLKLESDEDNNRLPLMSYIGQLFGTYILAQGEGVFYLIDQHAAAERVNYERIIEEISNEKIQSYELLIPMKFDFSSSEVELVLEKIASFNELGIDVEQFGGNTFMVRSVGTWIPSAYIHEYLEEIFTSIIYNKKTKKEEFIDSLAKSIACKKSIKGGEYHNEDEIAYLLKQLNKTKNPYTCPHGRPVITKFTKYDIEKWFKRVV